MCRLLCWLVLGIFVFSLVNSATKKADEDEEEDDDDDETTTKKGAVTAADAKTPGPASASSASAGAPPPPAGVPPANAAPAASSKLDTVELSKALENINEVINTLVKEGEVEPNFDGKAGSDSDPDATPARILKLVQDMLKVFVEANEIPNDTSAGDLDDTAKLLKTVQEILPYFYDKVPDDPNSPDAKYEGDIIENLLITVDEILKTMEDSGAQSGSTGASASKAAETAKTTSKSAGVSEAKAAAGTTADPKKTTTEEEEEE